MKVEDLAAYIRIHHSRLSDYKTRMMLYYVKVWTTINGGPYITGEFELIDGMVYITGISKHQATSLGVSEYKELIDFILFPYVRLSDREIAANEFFRLRGITCNIDETFIQKEYSSDSFARNFQNKAWNDGPYYILKTNSWYSFTFDMNEIDADKMSYYPSFAAYKKVVAEGEERIKAFMRGLLSFENKYVGMNL